MTPQDLAHHIQTAVKSAITSGSLELSPDDIPQQIVVERPKNPQHGDWATNIALQISKKAGLNPRATAEILLPLVQQITGVAAADIAGPGFINLKISAQSQGELAAKIVLQGGNYGRGTK